MTLPSAIQDREYQKFTDLTTGPAVRVSLVGGLSPTEYDTINVTYPTDTTEVYTFLLSAVTVRVITVAYTDNTKEMISSVVRS